MMEPFGDYIFVKRIEEKKRIEKTVQNDLGLYTAPPKEATNAGSYDYIVYKSNNESVPVGAKLKLNPMSQGGFPIDTVETDEAYEHISAITDKDIIAIEKGE